MIPTIKKILLPLFVLLCALLIMLHFNKKHTANNPNFTLKSYKNTVALYNGREIVEIYSEIVLNTLPEKDIQSFKNGISF